MTASLTVAVALCTYNGERFIREQLASILAQDRLPDEVVVSDDGSSDDTVSLVRDLLGEAAGRGVAVSILADGQRTGVTANFARAIAECTTDIVVLSDQDDVWHRDRISTALTVFESDDRVLLTHANAELIDRSGVVFGPGLFGALGVSLADRTAINAGDAFSVYLRRNLVTGATVAFRRRLVDVASPFPAEWVHDEWLAIIAAATGRVAVSNDTIIGYRQHGGNEIGVAEPTFRYRMARMLATAPDRNDKLAARAQILADRLRTVEGVPAEYRVAAAAKARFEFERSRLPVRRVARLPAIWRASRAGGYARFASQGRLDVLRDLVQSRT